MTLSESLLPFSQLLVRSSLLASLYQRYIARLVVKARIISEHGHS